MDLEKLPETTRFIVKNYLKQLFPRTPVDSLVLIVFLNISKMLCHKRVSINSDILHFSDVIPNIYTMMFSGSGTGKGRSIKSMKNIMGFFERDCKDKYKKTRDAFNANVERDADDKSASAKSKYIEEHCMRFLKNDITSESTFEGFIDQRKAFADANIGYTQWVDTEIYDSMANGLNHAFIKHNKEAFDHGETEDKTLKGNKEPRKFNVPHLVAIHGAINNSIQEELFKSFFDLGFARRSFLVMHKRPKKFKEYTIDDKKAFSTCVKMSLVPCKEKLKDIYYNTKNRESFTVTEDATNLYFEYQNRCEKDAFESEGINSEGVVSEKENRPWKMMKLACLVACQNHKDPLIKKADVEMAIYITDYYGAHFEEFYFKGNVIIEDKIVDMFIKNVSMTKIQIKRQSFFPADEGRQDKIIDGLFSVRMEKDGNDMPTGNNILDIKGTLREALSEHNKILTYKEHKGIITYSVEDFLPLKQPKL